MEDLNPMAVLDPSLLLQQQQAEQAQAYAQMLRQQSMRPLATNDMVSGRVVPINPLLPLAQVLMGHIAGRQQSDANSLTAGIAEKQGRMLREMIFGSGSPSPTVLQPPPISPATAALTQGAAAGDVGPTVGNAARMEAMPQPAQPQVPSAPQGGPMAMPGMSLQQAMVARLMGGPVAYTKAFLDRTDNRTDFTKTLIAAGIDPNSPQGKALVQAQILKQNYIAPTSLRPGGYVQNPNGTREQLPQMPEGAQAFQGPNGTWQAQPVPGVLPAVAALTAAKKYGEAPYVMTDTYNPVTKMPSKQFAGSAPEIVIPVPPGMQAQPPAAGGAVSAPTSSPSRPAPAVAGSQNFQQPGDTPDGVRSMIEMVRSNGGQPITPVLQASIDKEVARLQTRLAAITGSGGKSYGVPTGPALGEAATADALGKDSAKAAVQSYTDLHQHATASAQRAIGLLQSIEQLADKTIAGKGSGPIQVVNGILQTLGIPIGKDSAQNYQIMEKNLNMLVGAQRMGAGGGGTDALQHLLEAANPNAKTMNAPALKEAAQELIAYQRMLIAKDRAAPNPNTTSPQAYADFETKFAPFADPRLWQIEHAASDEERTRILSLMPAEERAAFLQRAKQARTMGVLN